MKFSVVLALVFFCGLSYAADEGVEFEVGGKADKTNIQKLYKTESPDDSESGDGASSGDGATDDTESSGDDNGSGGSGEGIDTTPSVVVVTTKPKRTKATTKKPKTKSTVEIINEVTDEPTRKTKTTDSNDPINVEKPTEDSSNTVESAPATMAIRDDSGNDSNKSGTVDFTVGIIVGVVVGAILAILVIVFLVYRLRKKDEGSYSLDEQSSQAFIRDEKANPGQGKEYFA